jgi:hypothetical protein
VFRLTNRVELQNPRRGGSAREKKKTKVLIPERKREATKRKWGKREKGGADSVASRERGKRKARKRRVAT